MGILYKVLSKAIVDPSFRERLTKDPAAAAKSAGIRMTKIEFNQLASFIKQHDLSRIKGETHLKQMLDNFDTTGFVSGVRG